MRPKRLVIIFITYVYTVDIPTVGSHRDNVFRVYIIYSNCARLHNSFLWWSMVKMAIYTEKCEQKWLKIINKGGWNKDVLGGKRQKNKNGGEGLFGTREYIWTADVGLVILFLCKSLLNIFSVNIYLGALNSFDE